MKPSIMAEVRRIAGDRLTTAMVEEIADRAIKIVEDIHRTAAIAAIETAKQTLEKASEVSAGREPNHKNDSRSAK